MSTDRRVQIFNAVDRGAVAERIRTARPTARLVQGRADWYRIENKTAAKAEIYIYDEIGYWGVTAQDFVGALQDVTAGQIDLHLNSPGGDVFDGIAILNALKSHKAKVTTYVDGLAASAASFIAMAGDEVVMRPNTEMMIHDALGLCVGNATDMRELALRLDSVSDNIASIYATRGAGTTAEWRARMQAETWYTAQEAVDAGLADRVASGGDDDAKVDEAKNRFDLSVFAYAGRDRAPQPEPAIETPEPFEWDPDAFRAAFAGLRPTAFEEATNQ